MRIIISILTIIMLPFFIVDKEKKEEKETEESIEQLTYHNYLFNYSLEYPATFEAVDSCLEDLEKKIVLEAPHQSKIVISGNRRVEGKDLNDLYEEHIRDDIDSLADMRLSYVICNGNYCEASYNSVTHHYYEKIFHQGSKMLDFKIVVPIEEKERMDKIKSMTHLDVNSVSAYDVNKS